MVENSNPGADSKQGESTSRKEKEREELSCVLEGGCTPPYIGQGGVSSSSPPPCGTKPPRGGGAPAIGGMVPTLGDKPKGGTPSSLNGPHGPI